MYQFYEEQESWTRERYYALWRYLNRFFLRATKSQLEEIDLSECTEITKVMMYCFIKTQKKDWVFEYPNLAALVDVKPLAEPLHLIIPPTNSNQIFAKYNIIF
jgi:hypothetical protein